MLAFCNKCRDTKTIKIKVLDPKKKPVEGDVICVACGTEVKVTDFTRRELINKREFYQVADAKVFQTRCHACEIGVEAKLDKQHHPRCQRCGARLTHMSPIMVNTMKQHDKYYMTEDELATWKLS